jgi:antitoxin MazE
MEIQTMAATVAKWGNSLAVRIPQNLAKEIQLAEGAEIDISVVDGTLVIKPRSRKRYSLEELIQGITPENLHAEIDSGIAVGNEVW